MDKVEDIDEVMIGISHWSEHVVEVSLMYHPMAARWMARLKRSDGDPIELYGRTAEIALNCLKEQCLVR